MKNLVQKLFLIHLLIIFLIPGAVLAQTGGPGPQIIWNGAVTVNTPAPGQTVSSGSINITGLTNPGQLILVILIDADNGFNPPIDHVYLGTPVNGNATFTAQGFPAGTFFKPVIIDMASYDGNTFTLDTCNFMFTTCITGPTSASTGGSGVDLPNNGTGVDFPTNGTGVDFPVDPGLGDYDFDSIHNPLCEGVNGANCDFDIMLFLQKLFANIVKIALPFMVLGVIYSGFLFVEAQGNDEKLTKARQNFLYVIIGAALILGAWTIATLLKGTVDQFEEPIAFLKLIINLV